MILPSLPVCSVDTKSTLNKVLEQSTTSNKLLVGKVLIDRVSIYTCELNSIFLDVVFFLVAVVNSLLWSLGISKESCDEGLVY